MISRAFACVNLIEEMKKAVDRLSIETLSFEAGLGKAQYMTVQKCFLCQEMSYFYNLY